MPGTNLLTWEGTWKRKILYWRNEGKRIGAKITPQLEREWPEGKQGLASKKIREITRYQKRRIWGT